MSSEFTPDQIVQGIAQALTEREIDVVPSLLKLLAVQDPHRAQDVLDVIEMGQIIRPTDRGEGKHQPLRDLPGAESREDSSGKRRVRGQPGNAVPEPNAGTTPPAEALPPTKTADEELRAAALGLLTRVYRVRDDWAEYGPGEARNRDLWQPMHAACDRLADALEAVEGAGQAARQTKEKRRG